MKRWRIVLAALLAVLAALALAGWLRIRPQAALGAGYVARQMCSCLFIGARGFESCRADIPPSMDRVRAEQTADGVRAWVPLFGERVARHHERTGCTLE